MDRGLRRRLDALIVLCSAVLGTVLTYLWLSPQTGPYFFVLALVPSAGIVLLAFLYVGATSAAGIERGLGLR